MRMNPSSNGYTIHIGGYDIDLREGFFVNKRDEKKQKKQLMKVWDYEVGQLTVTKQELDRLYWKLEDVTDERLVDSIIYEIKSQEAKYDYHYHNVRVLEERTNLSKEC